jgi:hypothetical protein
MNKKEDRVRRARPSHHKGTSDLGGLMRGEPDGLRCDPHIIRDSEFQGGELSRLAQVRLIALKAGMPFSECGRLGAKADPLEAAARLATINAVARLTFRSRKRAEGRRE